MKKYLKQGKYSYNESDLLGEGSFGIVYKGLNQITRKQVALKQILLSKINKQGDEVLKNILLSQISVMRKFNKKMQQDPCPFLVRQQDVFRTDKHIYIVMEICSGGTLEDQMRDRLLKQKHCIQILYCVAKGLQYMDQMGIVHRDLKPENIFISSVKLGQGEGKEMKVYKIGDFGFAAQKKQFDMAMGTIPYMAPEMFKKQKYNSKVDVWSVGVIGYQILYGGLYFIGKNTFQIQKCIKQKPFILNQKQQTMSSRNYQDFLNRCLNKDPNFRIPVNQLLNHPLFAEINKQMKSIQQTFYGQIKQNIIESSLQLSKKITSQQNKQELKIFQQTQVQQKSQKSQKTKKLQSSFKKISQIQPNSVIGFYKIQFLLKQCKRMRKLAEQFQNFQQNTPRIAQFLQMYLLKDAYVFMNRLTYSVAYKQNHIQLQQQQFNQLLKPEHDKKYNQFHQKCIQQCNYTTGIFNQKYKWFINQYITKFQKQDQQLIKIVINQQPYQQINTQIFQKQLRKWENVFINDQESGNKNYNKWKQLCGECRRMLDIRLKG